MTIHCAFFDTNLTMLVGHFSSMSAMASRMMFLMKVCPLLSTTASPKHPQSFTGLAITIHRVSRVMMLISASTILETRCLLMANNRKMPNENSSAASRTAPTSSVHSGSKLPIPIACR